jgi:hypothetical protein
MKKIFFVLILMSSVSALAQVKIPVYWECVLNKNDVVDCRDLEDAFEQGNGGFVMSSKDEARLNVRIGSNALNDFTEYVVRLTLKDQDEKEYKKKISDLLSSYEKTEKLIGFIQVTVNAAKEELDYQEVPTKEKPLYVEPSVYINGGKQPGSNYVNLGGDTSVNYSTPKYRVTTNGGAYIEKSTEEENAFTQKIQNNEFRWWASGGGAYSITDHVSIGAFAGYTQTATNIVTNESLGIPEDALNNTATRTSARVGVEWIKHPIISDKTNGNFSVRGYVVGEHHNYVDPQTFELRKETFARPTVDASYTKQFRTFNLTGSVSGFRSVGRVGPELQGVVFSGKANFNIKDTIIVEPNFSLDYTENRVRTTAGTNYSFMSLTGMQPNDNLTFKYGVTLKIPLGNARLSRQERRWKD